MTSILHIRARRFHALYAMLTGETGSALPKHRDIFDSLSRDVGLPEGASHECPINQLGIYVSSGKS